MNMMTSAYDDVERMSNRAHIQALNVGESFSRATRFNGDRINKDMLNAAERGLRLATQPTVHRVARSTGHKYTIECGEFMTRSRDLIVCLVVTRVQ